VRRKEVDDGAARIAKLQKLGHLVEGFTSGIIACLSYIVIHPSVLLRLGEVQMRVPAADHQCKDRKLQLDISFLAFLEQYGMNVPFQMVDRDQRLVGSEGQRLGIAESYQERSGQSRSLGDGDSVDGVVALSSILQRRPYDRHNGSQVLARSQFRHNAPIGLVSGNLRVHHVGDELLAGANDRRRSFVTRAFDSQDVDVGHEFYSRAS